jgi:hypothetical protein
VSALNADADEPAFEPVIDRPLIPATARELKRMIRDWRRGRATKNLGEAFSDGYVVVIGALMIGAMVINVILKAQRAVALCTTASCLSARTVLPWAAFAAAIAIALAVSRLSARSRLGRPGASGYWTHPCRAPNCGRGSLRPWSLLSSGVRSSAR